MALDLTAAASDDTNEAWQPQDWHAELTRDAADENRAQMRELPMNDTSTNEELAKNQPADILAGREPGTAESLFGRDSAGTIVTNCIRAEEASTSTPGQKGLAGIEDLMSKSLDALNVSIWK